MAETLRRRRSVRIAATFAILASLLLTAGAAAHPLGNFTINRAIVIEVNSRVEIRYLIDMAEIPAFEAMQRLDTNDDGVTGEDEADAYATSTCADVLAALTVIIDTERVSMDDAGEPSLSFPPGAGGLETLRLECRYVSASSPDVATDHRLEVRDGIDDGRIGWHEVTARATNGAVIVESDVPAVSPSTELTLYPEDALQTPPDIRAATITFRGGDAPTASAPPTPLTPSVRGTASDPLAALVGGELSLPIVLLAILVAFGLGAVHALSPGHGKTLVAAYVIGAGGDARSAVQIGLSVAVSHTAGVFALGVLTLVASELFLPERVIGWLSLVSGVIVAGLGLVLLARQWPLVRQATRGRGVATGAHHVHGPGGAPENAHEHEHEHEHEHGHSHEVPSSALTWRSALALGFAGGAVPSASAVIVLLVAISSDRLAFGSLLIVMFGAGMAIVLGGLGLVIARVGRAAGGADHGWLALPSVRRIGRWIPAVAGVVVFLSGTAFALAAAAQLS
ncbi:MAG: hypothetical protein ABIZ57_11070 [Candidatus Limnocylindria bacterium]